jgi:hypothetical protein
VTAKKNPAAKKEYKLDLFGKVLPALDRKDRAFYDNLTEEERKEITPYTLVRWMSAIGSYRGNDSTNPDIVGYYIRSVNSYVNKHMFDIPMTKDKDHKKLLWLMLTAASPGMGTFSHKYIKTATKSNALQKRIMSLFPNMKEDDAAALAAVSTKKEIDAYVKGYGQEDKKKKS